MVNLYQVLGLPYSATNDQIRAVLEQKQATLDAKTVKAVTEWLLVDDVRTRYDAKLRQEQPEFFQAADLESATPSNINLQKKAAQETQPNQPTETEQYYVPKLWNPTAAVVWGLFLSPIMGAWIHAINWQELGEEKLAKQNMYFVWSVVALGFVMTLIKAVAQIELPVFGISAAIWVAWFVFLGQKQIKFVRDEVNNEYDKKAWGKPIGLTILGLLAYFAVLVAFVFLLVIAGVIQLPTE